MTVLPALRAVGPCVRVRRLCAVCFSGVCTVCLMVCVCLGCSSAVCGVCVHQRAAVACVPCVQWACRPVSLGVPCCERPGGRPRVHAQGPLDTESMLSRTERGRGETRQGSRRGQKSLVRARKGRGGGGRGEAAGRPGGAVRGAGRSGTPLAHPTCRGVRSPPLPDPYPPPRGLHAGLDFQARRSPLSSFWLNGNKKQRGEVGGWGAWLSPQARREPGAGGRRRRGSASGGGRRRETRARREGKSFRPRSWRLRSFRRAGRRQSQANTAPAWARGGAAAGGGARARCDPWGETESRRGRGGRRKVTGVAARPNTASSEPRRLSRKWKY